MGLRWWGLVCVCAGLASGAVPGAEADPMTWGPEVNGLQAGLALGDPGKQVYSVGEALTFKCSIKNVSQAPITLRCPEVPYCLVPLVTDKFDASVLAQSPPRTPTLKGKHTLKPDEILSVPVCKLYIKPPALVRDPAEGALPAGAGKYKLVETGRFEGQGTGEWTGTLRTGPVAFELKALDPDAVTRQAVDELKYSVDRLAVKLAFHGDGPYRALQFQSFGERPAVVLSSEQIERLLDFLGEDDFFWRAVSSVPLREEATPPCYLLLVRGHLENTPSGEVEYVEPLGWGPKLLRRLKNLRAALDGEAAKAMDEWLKQFDADRKVWEPKKTAPETF